MDARERWSWGSVLSELADDRLIARAERTAEKLAGTRRAWEDAVPAAADGAESASTGPTPREIPGRGLWFRSPAPSGTPTEIAGRGIWSVAPAPAPPARRPSPRTGRHARQLRATLDSRDEESAFHPATEGASFTRSGTARESAAQPGAA